MKKNIILAVATVMAVGQLAHAGKGGGKEGEAPGAKAAHTEQAKGKAAELARTGPEASKSMLESLRKDSLLPSRMSKAQDARLEQNMANAEIMTALRDAAELAKKNDTRNLGLAIIEGITNLSRTGVNETSSPFKTQAQKDAKAADEALYTLLVHAGKQAEGWSNAALRENLTFLLQTVNDIMFASGGSKTNAEAMVEAQAKLAKPAPEGRSVKLDLEQIKKLCGPKA